MKTVFGILTLILALPVIGGCIYWHDGYSFKEGFIQGLWGDGYVILCFTIIFILFLCFHNDK